MIGKKLKASLTICGSDERSESKKSVCNLGGGGETGLSRVPGETGQFPGQLVD